MDEVDALITETDRSLLKDLEESLWTAETRFDRTLMEQVFAEDFYEIGRSGRIHTREACLGLSREPIEAVIPLPDFAVRSLGPNIAHVTYTSHVTNEGVVLVGHRSSIWTRDNGPWRLRFHQGTPVFEGTATG